MVVLALLMAGTSWAVASWVSLWLVPPYLILMALLLDPTAGRPQGGPVAKGSGESNPLPSSREDEDLDDLDSSSDDPASAGSPADGSGQGIADGPTKGRRGKARARKARSTTGPTEATWVQVAPGKFVRVEAFEEFPGQAGPHAPVGVPTEVPGTPPLPTSIEEGGALGRLENPPPQGDVSEARPEASGPIEDVRPAFDTFEGSECEPIAEIESEIAQGVAKEARSPGTFEGNSAADGNAPQAGDAFETTGAGGLDSATRAIDDRVGAEPGGGSFEEEDDLSPSSEGLEPIGIPAPSDVPSEDADEWGATLEGTDPTETPVDETDLDDAGPLEVQPREIGASRDADLLDEGTIPGPSNGLACCWPWRVSPRAGTRVGLTPRRSIGRPSPPGRAVRFLGGARRPTDPRRLTRRGDSRPRQASRTFPPRSPPGKEFGWRR